MHWRRRCLLWSGPTEQAEAGCANRADRQDLMVFDRLRGRSLRRGMRKE